MLVAFTVVLIFFFIHLSDIWNVLSKVITVLLPILYGLAIAYILNSPYRAFYCHAFKNMGNKHKWLKKLRKPLSLVLSYLIVLGILTFLVSILIPELSSSISTLIDNIPSYIKTVRASSDTIVTFIRSNTGIDLYETGSYSEIIGYITGDSTTKFLTNIFSSLVPSAVTTVVDIGTGLYNWILGFVISVYLLASKDTLLRQSKKLIVAYMPEKLYKRLFKIADVMNNKCGKFLIGKIIDSSIIGVMCFIGLSIFHFHYPLLISFIVGVMNMIPFFGPIIGAVPCALLLLLIDPLEALWFVVFIVVLQWFDGNILGPKVLGETVGISGFWIMVSVIVGGGLFGVPGMILGVPVFAAVYVLVREGVNLRLNKKNKDKIPQAPVQKEPIGPVEPSAQQTQSDKDNQ